VDANGDAVVAVPPTGAREITAACRAAWETAYAKYLRRNDGGAYYFRSAHLLNFASCGWGWELLLLQECLRMLDEAKGRN
jgi:hypothetical protein